MKLKVCLFLILLISGFSFGICGISSKASKIKSIVEKNKKHQQMEKVKSIKSQKRDISILLLSETESFDFNDDGANNLQARLDVKYKQFFAKDTDFILISSAYNLSNTGKYSINIDGLDTKHGLIL